MARLCEVVEGEGCEGGGRAPEPCDTAADDSGSGEADSGGVERSVVEGDGGCAVVPSGPWLALLVGLVVLLRRTTAAGLLLALAAPQVLAVDADLLDPLDGGPFVALTEAEAGEAWRPAAAVSAGWATGLVTRVRAEAREPLLSEVLATRAAASVRVGGLARLGVSATSYPHLEWMDSAYRASGDTTAWMTVPMLEGERPVHVATTVQLDAPTGSPGVYLGDAAGAVHARVSVDYHRGPVLTLLALGVRLSAPEYVPGNTWGDRLEGGFGVSARGLAGLSFGVELLASGSFVRQSWPDGDVPMELLGTASVDLPAGFALRAAAGGGLTHGLGSPSSRGLVVLDWRWPGLSDGDGDGVPDAFDRCPDVPEDRDGIDDADGCPEADADGDGIPDERDACPTQAEIFNGLLDDDGCPDRATQVDVLILTDEGSEIEVAQVAMAEEEPVGCLVERPCSFVVADGPNSLRVTADGYHPVEQTVQADGGQQDVVVRLVPVVYGGLLVRIVDETGAPLVGWTRIGGRTEVVDAGGRRFKLPVGTVEITALARGHDPRRMEVAVPVGTELEAVVQLAPTALVRDGARIVPRSTVFFALNSDVVAPEAEPDLDALAALLLSDPGLRLLRVEGHADERGNSVYNLDLSRRRASAVVDAIVARGVARERLEALGSGESRQAGAARSVDFLLLVWDETPAPD